MSDLTSKLNKLNLKLSQAQIEDLETALQEMMKLAKTQVHSELATAIQSSQTQLETHSAGVKNDLTTYAENQKRSIELKAQSSEMILAETMVQMEEAQKKIETSSKTFLNLKTSAENLAMRTPWQILTENAWESKKTSIIAVMCGLILMSIAMIFGMSMGAKWTINQAQTELSNLEGQINETRQLAASFRKQFPITDITTYGTPKRTVIELPEGMTFQKSVSLNGVETVLNKRNYWEIK